MPTGKPTGHPIGAAIGAAISYAPHPLGGGVKPLFKALGPGTDGEISTRPSRGTGDATFTRADGSTDIAHVRDFENNYKLIPANEARFQGARRVKNLNDYSEDLTQATVVFTNNVTNADEETLECTETNNSYWYKQLIAAGSEGTSADSVSFVVSCEIKLGTKSGPLGLRLLSGSDDYPLAMAGLSTTEWTRVSLPITTASTLVNGIHLGFENRSGVVTGCDTGLGTLYVRNIQTERVDGQSNQAPSEYVSRDVPFGEDGLDGSGNFNDASDWVLDAAQSITSGTLYTDGTQSSAAYAFQALSVDYSQWDWAVVYEVTGYVAGNHRALLGGVSGGDNTGNGTFTVYIDNPANANFNIGGDLNFEGTIDNVRLFRRTKGLKYFYTENNNEVAENNLLQSNTFDTTWTQANSIGITDNGDGTWDLEDAQTGSHSRIYQNVTVADDSNTHTISFFLKKDTSEASFPSIWLEFLNGTAISTYVHINKNTGDIILPTDTANSNVRLEDHDTEWKVICSVTNNGSGNTSLRVSLWPARAKSGAFGAADATSTGTITIRDTQFHMNSSVAAETVVETTTAAITNVVGTKTAQWEQVENLHDYSYDLDGSAWTVTGTDVVSDSTETFLGEAMQVLSDDNAGAYEYIDDPVPISDDSNWNCTTVLILKDNDETRFPYISWYYSGGTVQQVGVQVNTKTGALSQINSVGNTYYKISSYNSDLWRLDLAVQNNSSGNTAARTYIYPAGGTVWGTNSTSATGSMTVAHVQASSNRVLPYSELVRTNGSAITLGKERGLDDQLHPVGVKQNATYFKRFDKWEASTAYSVGDHIISDTGSGPAGGDGYYYVCVVAGTSAGSEPSFNTTIGDGTYDNGVVWKCLGKATVAGYLGEPARTNDITYSYDITQWTQVGTSVSALNETGIDGVTNHATTLTDDDGAAYEYVRNDITISDDSNTHTFNCYIKKDSDTSRYPRVLLQCLGGTSTFVSVHLNTQTGVTGLVNSSGTVAYWAEDHGDWWRVCLNVANNTSGNVTARIEIYPAHDTTYGGSGAIATTGSCIVGHAQLELNSSVPSSPILTTGAADARAEDVLSYDFANWAGDNQGTVLLSWIPTFPQSAAGSGNRGLFNIHGTSGFGEIYYQGGTNIVSYDSTTSANTSAQPGAFPLLQNNKLGLIWTTGANFQVMANSQASTPQSYDGSWTAGGDKVYIGNSGTPDPQCFTDVLVYNKDIGESSMDAFTAYD